MSLQKKTKAAAPQKAISTDELDAIMNEINELQSEMTESTKKPQAKAAAPAQLKVVPGGAEKKTQSAPVTDADITAMVQAEQEEDILAEFQAGGSADNSIESTLADLGEEPSAGNSILDQVDADSEPDMTSTPEHSPEESEEEPSMEVSSEEETADSAPSFEEEDRKDDLVDEIEEEDEPFAQTETEAAAETETDEISAAELESAILENAAEQDYEEPKEEPMAPANKNGSEGTLSMTLTGNMTLNIKYDVNGQQVTVGFSDNFLKVQLADGTEFKIPVGRPTTLKKVA